MLSSGASWQDSRREGPRRAAGGEEVVIDHDLRAIRCLRGILPEGWDEALDMVGELTEEMRYLPWADRAKAFDRFFWAAAKSRLTTEDVTAIVNRQSGSVSDPARVEAYTRYCRAVVTATLLSLDDSRSCDDEAAALVHYFSLDRTHQEAAVEWIGNGHQVELEGRLPNWPGCAFLLLILSPSDSAESFLARDAFWAAMLGRA
jgi:hypothetical protein